MVAAASLATIILFRTLAPRVPGTIVALAGGTVAAAALGLDVETIGSRFGGIPSGLPVPHIPAFEAALVPVRVLDCAGNGNWSGIISGIDWAIKNHPDKTAIIAAFQ